jgi:hypothetical protein
MMVENWSKTVTRLKGEIVATRQRLDELETALAAIAPLAGDGDEAPGQGRKGRGAGARKGAKPGKRAKANGKAQREDLPATGSDVWLGIIGEGQKTAAEMVDAAMRKLKIEDGARRKIYSRASNWLNGAVKKSLVSVAGQRNGINVYQKA